MKKTKKKILITNSNHIIIECLINNVKGRFILDTGASNTCVNLSSIEKFNLDLEKFDELASSANSSISESFCSKKNEIKIGEMTENDVSLIVFDMGHINKILKEKKINFIDGIIGGDILIKYNACIDYDKGFLILNF